LAVIEGGYLLSLVRVDVHHGHQLGIRQFRIDSGVVTS
jgi:hypothetical protein